MRKLILHIAFFLASAANASVITLVGPSQELIQITHDVDRTWRLNDLACLSKPKEWDEEDEYKAPCGWVIMTTFRGAIVKFPEAPDDLEKGRGVVQGEPPINGIAKAEAARREVELKHWEEMFPFYFRLLNGSGESSFKDFESGGSSSSSSEFSGISSGTEGIDLLIGAGFNLFRSKGLDVATATPGIGIQIMPSMLSAQASFEAGNAFGLTAIMSSFADGEIEGKTTGVILSYHLYPDKVYDGLWYQVGAGLLSTTTTSDDELLSYNSYVALGTAGWRLGGKRFNFGGAVGLQVVYAPEISELDAGLLQFLPAVMLDVCIRF